MTKKYVRQNVEADVSTPEQALAQTGQVSIPKTPRMSRLATNDPKTPKGYEKLGPGGPVHTGKPTATENRGEGSA